VGGCESHSRLAAPSDFCSYESGRECSGCFEGFAFVKDRRLVSRVRSCRPRRLPAIGRHVEPPIPGFEDLATGEIPEDAARDAIIEARPFVDRWEPYIDAAERWLAARD
jgi:hypothetical protein